MILRDLGSNVPYAAALAWQEEALATVAAGGEDTLFLLEHAPVYTLGRSAKPENLLAARDPSIEVYNTTRGGDVTYHGPGQLVGYPVINLRRRGLMLLEYLRLLEDALIQTLAQFEINGVRDNRNRGVWVGNAKIAAIGVRVSRGVSMHGFALNVDPDMAHFTGIIPCGIADAGVTSMRLQLGRPVAMDDVKQAFARALPQFLF
jgi:lipoate-protein ligase B